MKKMLWILTAIFLLIVLIASWIGKGTIYQSFSSVPDSSQISHADFKVIAHRGYSSKAPENTLSAFKLALESGADMIELDVHLSKDNQVIVMHDASLERTTDATGAVRDKTVQELKTLDAGAWYDSSFKNEPVPTLEDVLKLIDGQNTLLIEIKVDDNNETYPGLVRATLDLITKYNAADWCILQAFESAYLKEIQEANYTIQYYKLIVNTHSPIPTYIDSQFRFGTLDTSIPFQAINPYYKTLVPQQVSQWQAQGYEVYTYTVNELEDMKLIANMGVDGIITNYPKRAVKLREEIRKRLNP